MMPFNSWIANVLIMTIYVCCTHSRISRAASCLFVKYPELHVSPLIVRLSLLENQGISFWPCGEVLTPTPLEKLVIYLFHQSYSDNLKAFLKLPKGKKFSIAGPFDLLCLACQVLLGNKMFSLMSLQIFK